MSNISAVVPYQAVTKTLASTSKYIQRAEFKEILPSAQVTYSPDTNNVIEFNIASKDDFLSLADSYIKFKLTTNLKNNAVLDLNRALAQGGAHSLFRRIAIRTNSGTLLDEWNHYNLCAATLSDIYDTPDYIESQAAAWGDSINPLEIDNQKIMALFSSGFSCTDTTLTITTPAIPPSSYIDIGDVIVGGLASAAYTGVVTSVTGTQIICAGGWQKISDGSALGAGPTTFTQVFRISKGQAARAYAASNGGDSAQGSVTLCMQPLLSMFKDRQWFPLFLLFGGIRIELTLEPIAARVLQSPNGPQGATAFVTATTGYDGFKIDNPRFIARMVTPAERLRDLYLEQFRGDGVFMIFRSYLFSDITSTSNTLSNQISVGRRGVNHVYAIIQDERHRTKVSSNSRGVDSHTIDCMGERVDGCLDKYDFNLLSYRYPLNTQIEAGTSYNSLAEPLTQLALTAGRWAQSDEPFRFKPADWRRENLIGTATVSQSKKLILAADFTKDRSIHTGVDLGHPPIQVNMTFSTDHTYLAAGTATSRYIALFVNYDAIVNFQQMHGVIVQG